MANLLSNTTIGGYQSIHTGNIGSYALTSLPSHNHDDRYFTETESDGRFQPLENQRLSTGNSPTFVDIYSNNWFRNNSNNTGLYNQANGNHFYSRSGTQWGITSNGSTVGSLMFYRNHESVLEGQVYFDTSGFGLLNRNADWAVRSDRDNTSVRLYHSGAEKLRTDGSGAYVTGRLDVSNYIYTPQHIIAKNIQGPFQVLNLDTIKEPGLYQYDGGIGGTQPLGTDWYNVKTIEIGSDGRYSQFVMPYSNNRIFYRSQVGGTWLSYVELITSGNIGSQSVNYATTAGALSSMNISQFTNNSGYITSSSLSSYLPLAGGTMSGQIYGPNIGTGTYDGLIQVRETGYVTTSQSAWGYAPGITYHWGGRAASKVGLRSDGLFAIDNEPFATRSWTTSQGFITGESDTLASVTGRGATTASQMSFTKTDDHAISVGTIRGRAVGVQTGEFIQLYERVNIGGPSGWGASNTSAPTQGLSVYGGATIGYGTSAGLTVTGTTSATRYTLSGTGAYMEGFGSHSSKLGRVAIISLDWNSNYDEPYNHGIMSTNSNGDFADSLSINSFNDITLRLDANNNNSESYVRIMNNTQGSNTIAYIGHDGGSSVAWFGGVATAANDFRAPIFYDSANTNYYGDFASTSVMNSIRFGTSTNNATINGNSDWGIKVITDVGYIHLGPANSSYAHIYTDRPTFYFNKDLLVNGSTVITAGTIGSQSVSYANSAGSATTAGSATSASQLTKYGDIYGDNWNSYYVSGKLIVSAALGMSGANKPPTSYDYGVALSYGESGGPLLQWYFPENSGNIGTIFRKGVYRTGWNGNWSTWKTLVEQEGNLCTIVGGNGTGLEVHGNVGYNQDPLTYFLLRGQADTSWKALKVRLTGDAGGQDIEFRRIAENGADSRMWYVPRGGNTVNFDYPIVQPSDSRLKDNITPITTPVEKIKALSGVEFDWNSGEQVGTHDVGLIAQDVEAVLPEAVTTQEDGYKNLAYTKVIPLLVEAMKEQQTMIEALKAEIELLKNR